MPPKRKNPSGRKKKWALIWWTATKSTNVVALSAIPSNDRSVNSITTLLWQATSGRKEKFEAKVMAIGYDASELKKISVSASGDICDSTQRIFSNKVLTATSNLAQQNKLMKSVKNDNLQKVDDILRKNRRVLKTLNNSNSETFQNQQKNTQKMPSTSTVTSFNYSTTGSFNHRHQNSLPSISSTNLRQDNNMVKISEANLTINDRLPKSGQNLYTNKRKHMKHSESLSFNDSDIISNKKYKGSKNLTKLSDVKKTPSYNDVIQKNSGNDNCTFSSYYFDEDTRDHDPDEEFQCADEENQDHIDNSTNPSLSTATLGLEVERNNNSQEIYLSRVRAFALQIPYEVSDEEISHLEFVLNAYKHARSLKTGASSNKKLDYFLKPGDDRKEIAKGHKFYIGTSAKHLIENKALKRPGVYDWEIIVKETLNYVYGKEVHNYCALGSNKGNHPAINEVLYTGLYEWACQRAKETIDTSRFIKVINIFCGNKRPYAEGKKDQCFEEASGSDNSKGSSRPVDLPSFIPSVQINTPKFQHHKMNSVTKKITDPKTSHAPEQAQMNRTAKTHHTIVSSVTTEAEITTPNPVAELSNSASDSSQSGELLYSSNNRNLTTRLDSPSAREKRLHRDALELSRYLVEPENDDDELEIPTKIVNENNKFYFKL